MTPPVILAILIVVIAAIIISQYLILERWMRHKQREWAFQLKADNNRALASLRLSAYERIFVMLERISPTPLVMRQNVTKSSAALLQLELIKAIREEFEHNVSLQMYVSPECWEKVKRAKEETTELVKVAFSRIKPENTGMDLGREIFKLEAATGNSAIRDAIAALRHEMGRHF
jgi:hypothetical protein